jgi:hypothetical protein
MLGIDPTRPAERRLPAIGLIGGSPEVAARLDYPRIEVLGGDAPTAARATSCEVVALLPPGGKPAGNWLSAAAAFFARAEVAAVVVPSLAPPNGSVRRQAASAVLESRFGAGSRLIRFSPGNIRTVSDYPAGSIVIRREDYVAAGNADVEPDRLVSWLTTRGREVVYTPEAMMILDPPPVLVPHLRSVARYARSRGVTARYTRGRSLTLMGLVTLAPFGLAVTALPLLATGGTPRSIGWWFLAAYGMALTIGAVTGSLRFRSARVGLLVPPTLVATHVVYVAGFLAGVARRR